jgi:uncharacterized Zn finger protein
MRKLNDSLRIVAVLGAIVAMVFGSVALFTEVQAKRPGSPGGCVCPMVYAPVVCDHGKVYSNQCVADCRNAKNCVPLGPGPVPL